MSSSCLGGLVRQISISSLKGAKVDRTSYSLGGESSNILDVSYRLILFRITFSCIGHFRPGARQAVKARAEDFRAIPGLLGTNATSRWVSLPP